MREAVMHDPIVMEARAELISAQSRIEQASSAHWPVGTATGSKLLSQSPRYSDEYGCEDCFRGSGGAGVVVGAGGGGG
ncbi:TolC family protein, partial [Escherichia coli]|nr:TolC family protein [Escherichia coli]